MPYIPTLPVLPGDILNQPFDGVVRVGALVDVLRAALDGLVRPDDDVIAFAHVAAANVLVDEDEFLAREEFGRPEIGAVLIDAVGRHAVAGALHQDRVSLPLRDDVLGDVDRREELDAIAHRDETFELVVVFPNEVTPVDRRNRRGRGRTPALCRKQTRCKKKNGKKAAHGGWFPGWDPSYNAVPPAD